MNDEQSATGKSETVEKLLGGAKVVDLWPGAVSEASGFVAVPLTLLRSQTKLGLTSTEMMVLINLLAHRWKPGDAVFPRTSTIAKRVGVTPRTVQRATEKLVAKGLAQRLEASNGRRDFKFESLVDRLVREMPETLQIKANETFGT